MYWYQKVSKKPIANNQGYIHYYQSRTTCIANHGYCYVVITRTSIPMEVYPICISDLFHKNKIESFEQTQVQFIHTIFPCLQIQMCHSLLELTRLKIQFCTFNFKIICTTVETVFSGFSFNFCTNSKYGFELIGGL